MTPKSLIADRSQDKWLVVGERELVLSKHGCGTGPGNTRDRDCCHGGFLGPGDGGQRGRYRPSRHRSTSPWVRPAARAEVRAVYGGFGLAIASMLAVALATPDLRTGILTTVAAALAGMAFGRLVSALVGRTAFYRS